MTVNDVHYQICEYDSRWTGPNTAIWESNKAASNRKTQEPIFKISGLNHQLCAELFLDHLGVTNDEVEE
jgi:hypothetical protein